MNTMRLAAALGIVSIMAGATGFIACSSSDSTNPPPSGDGSTDGNPQNNPDGGNPGNGGDSGGVPYDASLAPDPGQVSCGSNTCHPTPDEYCCVNDGGANCGTDSTQCSAGSLEAHCDEAADCPTGNVCCGSIQGFKLVVTCVDVNMNKCPSTSTQYQVCKTDAECQNNAGCKIQNCAGAIVHTCGGINNSNCSAPQ